MTNVTVIGLGIMGLPMAKNLVTAGYDVVGVTLQLYDHGSALKKKGACCAGQDIHDARLAADMIGMHVTNINFVNLLGRVAG